MGVAARVALNRQAVNFSSFFRRPSCGRIKQEAWSRFVQQSQPVDRRPASTTPHQVTLANENRFVFVWLCNRRAAFGSQREERRGGGKPVMVFLQLIVYKDETFLLNYPDKPESSQRKFESYQEAVDRLISEGWSLLGAQFEEDAAALRGPTVSRIYLFFR